MKTAADLPSLFDSKGVFQELPPEVQDALDEVRAITYQKIKSCAADLKAVDQRVADAIEHVKKSNDAEIDFQNFMHTAFPPKTFNDLWKETFGRK